MAVPPVQAPPLQVSPDVQSSPSLHVAPSLPGGWLQVPLPLHWSFVHGFPSLVHAVPAGSRQLSAASLQVSAHSGPPVQGLPTCTQVPPLHVSGPLQKSPSSHGAVLFGCVQAPAPLHWSFVHALPSSVHRGAGGPRRWRMDSLQA